VTPYHSKELIRRRNHLFSEAAEAHCVGLDHSDPEYRKQRAFYLREFRRMYPLANAGITYTI